MIVAATLAPNAIFNSRVLDKDEEAHMPLFDPDSSGHFCWVCGIETLDSIHDPSNYVDPGLHAAKDHAERTGCYCSGYTNHLCSYHQGFEDGFDAAIEPTP